MNVRVLHCDDSSSYRRLLRAALEDEEGIEFVGEADRHDAVVEAARRVRPDVVLLDMLTEGETIIEDLRATFPDIRVVMLSGHPRGYGADSRPGAAAYVEKGEPIDVLVRAITGA